MVNQRDQLTNHEISKIGHFHKSIARKSDSFDSSFVFYFYTGTCGVTLRSNVVTFLRRYRSAREV